MKERGHFISHCRNNNRESLIKKRITIENHKDQDILL